MQNDQTMIEVRTVLFMILDALFMMLDVLLMILDVWVLILLLLILLSKWFRLIILFIYNYLFNDDLVIGQW